MRGLLASGVVAVTLALSACSPGPTSQFRPTATVREIMDAIVDPNADFIWDSVEVLATRQGTTKKEPRTEEDWKALRLHTIALIEATNLLLVPGRQIARPGEKAEDPRVDLQPEEIQTRMNQNRDDWISMTRILHDAGMESLDAVNKKDVRALLNAGDVLDQACESCHVRYWYRKAPGYAQ
jgi:hypothetical protein